MGKDAQEVVSKESNNREDKSASLVAEIDSLIDQALQIYELTSKEAEIIESIGSSVSILLTTLKASLSLSQSIFQNDFPAIKSAILNNNAEIIIMQANGNIVTKKFSELDSGQVMNIMSEIVPKLGESAQAKKVEVTEKIDILRKIAKQFQRVKVEMKPEYAAKEEE
jgi:hypothetical protein